MNNTTIIRSAPVDIALVKAMHITWKMRIRAALNGTGKWQDVHANNPEQSEIGKWIEQVGLWKYQHEPIFHMFLEQHQLLHKLASQIQQHHESGQIEEARALLTELDRLSEDFLKLIDTYKTVLEGYKSLSNN
ncbi:MAG: hypothetical protein SNJ55_10780 [Chloroherpetonaceae bacterium]